MTITDFLDRTPLTDEYLLSQGFCYVESDLGPEYKDHLKKDGINIWANSHGEYLLNDFDSIGAKTIGELNMIIHLMGSSIRLK